MIGARRTASTCDAATRGRLAYHVPASREARCPCPHWGYTLSGAIHLRYADGREEVSRAGELFYWPSGHTVRVEEDTTFVEFSPKRELKEVYDHIGRKVAA